MLPGGEPPVSTALLTMALDLNVAGPSLFRQDGKRLPGPQCESRPDAGRAPPIA